MQNKNNKIFKILHKINVFTSNDVIKIRVNNNFKKDNKFKLKIYVIMFIKN